MANKRYGHAEEPLNDRRPLLVTVGLLLLLSVTMLFLMRGLLQKHYSVHTVSGTSMTPTLTEKDQVLVKKRTSIQRYDIIAFSISKEEGMFVKRVVGLPGDEIFVRNDRMVLDMGEQGAFETTNTYQLSPTIADEFQQLTRIPEDAYFVIGDHVDVSRDSRVFGFVHRKSIEGTVQIRLPAMHLVSEENE